MLSLIATLAQMGAAGAVLIAVVLFLKDRRSAQANGYADRRDERGTIVGLAENAMSHLTDAVERQAVSNEHIAKALERMAEQCPCGKSD